MISCSWFVYASGEVVGFYEDELVARAQYDKVLNSLNPIRSSTVHVWLARVVRHGSVCTKKVIEDDAV